MGFSSPEVWRCLDTIQIPAKPASFIKLKDVYRGPRPSAPGGRGPSNCPPTHCEPLNPSCPTITYGHLFAFYDYWHLPRSAREFKHLFEFTAIHLHVHILSIIAISRPGLFRIGSTRLAINNDLLCHNPPFNQSLNLTENLFNILHKFTAVCRHFYVFRMSFRFAWAPEFVGLRT